MMKLYLCNINSRLVVKEKKLRFRIYIKTGTWSTEKAEGLQTSKNVPTGM
jgi:hypothetical protein